MKEDKKPYIFFDNISFRYTDIPVLEHATLSMQKNEFCLLIGPNGGGKTTLIKLLIGLLKPKKGLIAIDGEAPANQRLSIGYVPQSLHFDSQFPISTGEFVMLGALSQLSWYGVWPKEVEKKAMALLEEVHLASFFYTPFGSLSGGQKQRATLIRALMCDPSILILDEPINNLDIESAQLFIDILNQAKGKKTILLISHYVDALIEKADSIYVVNQSIEKIEKQKVCSHYSLGMYHQQTRKGN